MYSSSFIIAALMRNLRSQSRVKALLVVALIISSACRRSSENHVDQPRLAPNVILQDVTFRSVALNRDMEYRVILPRNVPAGRTLQVVYLLHGNDGGFRDWSNHSDVANFAESGLLLVMPEGGSSYYTNALVPPQDRYEDYIVYDLISDVERRFPAAAGGPKRAIVGVSMGGYGAIKLGLHHPELFAFVGAISAAVDVPRRPFTIRRIAQSRHYDSIFGPSGSQTRRANDPFVLARATNPADAPYFYLTCGDQEGLLGPNREFSELLAQRHFKHEFHTIPGGHDWAQWNASLPGLFRSLIEHISASE